jgi:PIN domain nuclease of toxin-antitoxin system
LADPIVLDSSAMLAFLLEERGADAVLSLIEDVDAIVLASTVNLCEVSTKLTLTGASSSVVAMNMGPFMRFAVDFDSAQALYAGELARSTRPQGLSLGDRACLALAASRGATAWTTDAAWLKLQSKTGVKVRLLRA